ncbi:DUF3509 domain-containing protein [Pseudomonas sp. VE 196-7]|nr:DUF3509 domain-containing protein [Pseudomonas sp. VE 196-7]MCU7214248.1 DUF3509 domain-containing protein [Pseudomonas sp. VE 196-7]
MTCVAGKVGIENTTALLKLYTRFLQCFVSARSCLAAEIAPLPFGSVQLKRIPQNAGCTMAIHAVCTTRANFMIFKLLILKDFLFFKYWHNRCNLLCMLALQVHTELKDMSLIQEKFTSLFSNFNVTTAPRPDGGILLTLRSSEGKVFKRALTYQQMHNADQLSWAISAIRRDLAEEASELPQIAMLQSQQRFALPTYHSL